MQILEDRRHTSPSNIIGGLARSARFSWKLVVSCVAVGERLRTRQRLVCSAGKLRSVPDIIVAFREAKCAVLLGLVGVPLTFSVGFCAIIEVQDALFVRISVVSVGDALAMGCSVNAASSVDTLQFPQIGTGLHVTES